MSNKLTSLTTKRFIIRKSLLGQNTHITFTNKKGDTITYDHDKVYNVNKERFESMNCFQSINLIQIQTTYQHFVET